MLVSPLCAPFLYIFMANGKVLWEIFQMDLWRKDAFFMWKRMKITFQEHPKSNLQNSSYSAL